MENGNRRVISRTDKNKDLFVTFLQQNVRVWPDTHIECPDAIIAGTFLCFRRS